MEAIMLPIQCAILNNEIRLPSDPSDVRSITNAKPTATLTEDTIDDKQMAIQKCHNDIENAKTSSPNILIE